MMTTMMNGLYKPSSHCMHIYISLLSVHPLSYYNYFATTTTTLPLWFNPPLFLLSCKLINLCHRCAFSFCPSHIYHPESTLMKMKMKKMRPLLVRLALSSEAFSRPLSTKGSSQHFAASSSRGHDSRTICRLYCLARRTSFSPSRNP